MISRAERSDGGSGRTVLCVGEALFDRFGHGGSLPGGAPLNVGVQLARLGAYVASHAGAMPPLESRLTAFASNDRSIDATIRTSYSPARTSLGNTRCAV